jgi:glycosyltransferase involved in cell wall biosynthesis
MSRRLRILTWHVHGNYMFYLSHSPHDFYLLSDVERSPGYGGKCGSWPWGGNVHDCPVENVMDREFDCVLVQSRKHYLEDRSRLLTPAQQRLPTLYLEHDPPLGHPTDTRHVVEDPSVLVVHVTHYNALMWDHGGRPTRVVEHGVIVPAFVQSNWALPRGACAINNLGRRGRRLGSDVFARMQAAVPLDLFGMESEAFGAKGDWPYHALMPALADYRWYCHPVRYTSLALAVCEAMMIGLPIVGLATTELASVVRDGETGFVDSNVDRLIVAMQTLAQERGLAQTLGARAQKLANERFHIGRFASDWSNVFHEVTH